MNTVLKNTTFPEQNQFKREGREAVASRRVVNTTFLASRHIMLMNLHENRNNLLHLS